MSSNVHYDVEKAEREFRAMMEKFRANGQANVDAGTANPEFFKAQLGFVEARVQFALAPPRLGNEGIADEDIAAAAGVAIGSMYSSLVLAFASRPELRSLMDEWIAQSTADHIAGATSVGGPEGFEMIVVPSIKGGHA